MCTSNRMRFYLSHNKSNITQQRNPKKHSIQVKPNAQHITALFPSEYLSGTHCSFEGGEAVIEGTENGNHVIGDGLASVKRVFHERCSFSESNHGLRNSHCERFFSIFLSFSRFCLVSEKMKTHNAFWFDLKFGNWLFRFWILLRNEMRQLLVVVLTVFPRSSPVG